MPATLTFPQTVRLSPRLQPAWLKGHYRMGQALEELRRFMEAAEAYHAAYQLDSTNADILVRAAHDTEDDAGVDRCMGR